MYALMQCLHTANVPRTDQNNFLFFHRLTLADSATTQNQVNDEADKVINTLGSMLLSDQLSQCDHNPDSLLMCKQ